MIGVILTSILALTMAACGQDTETAESGEGSNEQITVEHAQGSLTLDRTPETIAVMDPGSLDTVDALGAGDKVVGVSFQTTLPEDLADYQSDDIADLGNHKEPDLEKLAELDPDLVIVGFRTAALYEELSQNFNVIDVTYEQTKPFMEGLTYATDIIGTALDKTTEADEQLAEVEEAMTEAKDKVEADTSAMILMTSGGTVSLHGAESRFGMIHKDLGFEPAISEVADASHGDPISFEAIQEANPGVMFVIDRDATVGEEGENAEAILDNELVNSTDAWKNDKVVYLQGGRWYILIHGVNNAVEMIKEATADL